MGSVVKSVFKGVSKIFGGALDSLGLVDEPEVKTTAVEQVAEDKKKSAKKRKALYSTQGGVLGQEVNQVGESSRGNLFGN